MCTLLHGCLLHLYLVRYFFLHRYYFDISLFPITCNFYIPSFITAAVILSCVLVTSLHLAPCLYKASWPKSAPSIIPRYKQCHRETKHNKMRCCRLLRQERTSNTSCKFGFLTVPPALWLSAGALCNGVVILCANLYCLITDTKKLWLDQNSDNGTF